MNFKRFWSEGVMAWGSEGTVPLIINLDTKWVCYTHGMEKTYISCAGRESNCDVWVVEPVAWSIY